MDSDGWSLALDARRKLMKEVGQRIATLRIPNFKRRMLDFCISGILWSLGILLITFSDFVSLPLRYGFWAAGIILSALALNMAVLLLHEGMHSLLFRNPRLNYWCSVILGAILGISFTVYRKLHFLHHVHLGGKEDPDNYNAYTSSRGLEWLMQYGRLLIGSFLYLLLMPALAWKKANPEERKRIIVEYSIVIAMLSGIIYFLPNTFVLYCWFMPLIFVGYFTAVRGLSEHSFVDFTDPFTASRTISSGPVAEFFLLGVNYHLAHHLFPEIPSYNLRKLHQLIFPRLPKTVVEKSYFSFLVKFFNATRTLDRSPIGLVDFKRGA